MGKRLAAQGVGRGGWGVGVGRMPHLSTIWKGKPSPRKVACKALPLNGAHESDQLSGSNDGSDLMRWVAETDESPESWVR